MPSIRNAFKYRDTDRLKVKRWEKIKWHTNTNRKKAGDTTSISNQTFVPGIVPEIKRDISQ